MFAAQLDKNRRAREPRPLYTLEFNPVTPTGFVN